MGIKGIVLLVKLFSDNLMQTRDTNDCKTIGMSIPNCLAQFPTESYNVFVVCNKKWDFLNRRQLTTYIFHTFGSSVLKNILHSKRGKFFGYPHKITSLKFQANL